MQKARIWESIDQGFKLLILETIPIANRLRRELQDLLACQTKISLRILLSRQDSKILLWRERMFLLILIPPDDFTDFIIETAGPLQKMLAYQRMERKKQILGAITGAAPNYVDKTTGKTRFENEAILIVGAK